MSHVDSTLSLASGAQETYRFLVGRYNLTPVVHIRIIQFRNGQEQAYVTSDGWASIAKAENASVSFGELFVQDLLGQKALCVICTVKTGKKGARRKFSMVGAVPFSNGSLSELIKKVHTNAMARAIRFALGLDVRCPDDGDEPEPAQVQQQQIERE